MVPCHKKLIANTLSCFLEVCCVLAYDLYAAFELTFQNLIMLGIETFYHEFSDILNF